MPIETLTHQEEFESWREIEGFEIECNLCQTCYHYYLNTDYCLLGLFEQDEKQGERFLTEECLYWREK